MGMASPILGVTALDIRKKINPLNEEGLFQYGPTHPITEADVDDRILEAESSITGRIRERYRKLLRSCDGEILTKYAPEGTTTLTLGLTPASNVKLYVNYDLVRPWSDRNADDVLEADQYTIPDLATGLITFTTPLSKGTRVYAEYDHTASSTCHVLRRVCINLVAYDYVLSLPYEPAVKEQYGEWKDQANSDLTRLSDFATSPMGLDLFDNLTLVRETRREGTSINMSTFGLPY